MHATLPFLTASDFPAPRRDTVRALQVNLGHTCNQSCVHCHVNAGLRRTEQMSRGTIDTVLAVLAALACDLVDDVGRSCAPPTSPRSRPG